MAPRHHLPRGCRASTRGTFRCAGDARGALIAPAWLRSDRPVGGSGRRVADRAWAPSSVLRGDTWQRRAGARAGAGGALGDGTVFESIADPMAGLAGASP